jgi:hypothetical protein
MMVDGSHEEPIERMWKDYAPIRDEVVGLLSDWQKGFVRGDPKEIRDEIRSFADRQEGVFQLLALCFYGSEQFWADVEETLGESDADHLQEISERYQSQLGELFRAVYVESVFGHYNTITDTSTNIEMKNRGSDAVIKFEAFSGRVPILELHESPSHFLDLAETHVSSVDSALNVAKRLDENEIENIQRQLDRLEKKVEDATETMNSIEANSDDDNDDSLSPETTDEDYE